MRCWVVGGNNGLGDVLWLLNEAKHEANITYVGIPRTVELVETIKEYTTVDIHNIVTIDNPEACINAPGIPEYQLWTKKWYTPHPGETEYFFNYPHHGSFGSVPLRKERQPRGYIVSQLFSHRQPHHFWPPTVEALNESGRTVYSVVARDDEPWAGMKYKGSLRQIAELILGANLFVGLASGITTLAVFLGVPTIMAAATPEDMKSIPPHMDYLIKPSKETLVSRINERF